MSLEVSLEHNGIEKLQRKIQTLDTEMERHVHENLEYVGNIIHATAKKLAPLRTGHLRSTIYFEASGWTLKIGARATYAFFVEFGTKHFSGRRFLTGSLQMHSHHIQNALTDAVKQAIDAAKVVP